MIKKIHPLMLLIQVRFLDHRGVKNEKWITRSKWKILHTASFTNQNLRDFSNKTYINVHREKKKTIYKSLFRSIYSFWYARLYYCGRHRNHCFLNKAKENLIGFPLGKKSSGILPSKEIVKTSLFTPEGFLYAISVYGIIFSS